MRVIALQPLHSGSSPSLAFPLLSVSSPRRFSRCPSNTEDEDGKGGMKVGGGWATKRCEVGSVGVDSELLSLRAEVTLTRKGRQE